MNEKSATLQRHILKTFVTGPKTALDIVTTLNPLYKPFNVLKQLEKLHTRGILMARHTKRGTRYNTLHYH